MRVNGSQPGEVNHLIPVSNGLLTPQHVKAIGVALFPFLYYVDGITSEQDGFGLVHGGKPLPDEKVSKTLGIARATIARWRGKLAKEGYIAVKKTGAGYIIRVAKSKKFLWRRNGDAGRVPISENLVLKNENQVLTFGTSRSDIHTDIHTDSSLSEAKGPSDQARALAGLLRSEILKNNPKAKAGSTDHALRNWAVEADDMMRLDGRTEAEIRELIEWSQRHSFWKGNILSMGNLRKHFDQLTLKKGVNNHGTGVGNRKPSGAIPPPVGKYDHQKPDFTFNVDHQ